MDMRENPARGGIPLIFESFSAAERLGASAWIGAGYPKPIQ